MLAAGVGACDGLARAAVLQHDLGAGVCSN